MAKYISIDTEATGLEEHCQLIQVAMVPVDTTAKKVLTELGKECLIHCPTFEELKPTLSTWVIEHNEGLIRDANAKGLTREAFKKWAYDYMNQKEVVAFFDADRPPILGKSLSALDIPMLTRYLGKPFMEKYFHHHTLDVTCIARYMVDSGQLPKGCQSTSKLLQYYGIRNQSNHTALSDAVDMGEVYLKMLEGRQAGA